jgi:hypothetical protein
MRMMFGGGADDSYLTDDDDGDLQRGAGVQIFCYSSEFGDNPVTDLLDLNLSPISYVTTSTGSDSRAPGRIPPFYGPDEVFELWAGPAGQPRALLKASNLGSTLGPIRAQYLQHAAQSNGHGTGLQDLVNVSAAGVNAATDGQALVYQSSSGLWVAGSVVTGGGGSGDATLAGSQTFTGEKTFSALQTTTGGQLARPAATSGQARIVQALASQSGNVEEWRDSTGAVKAWMTSAFALRAPNLSQTITFAKAGAVTTGVGTMRFYNDRGVALTILSVRVNVGTASTSGTPTVDVNVGGTSIYGVQSNRPTVAIGAFTSGKVIGHSTTTVADGSWITADIDTAGTGAADLIVQIEVG